MNDPIYSVIILSRATGRAAPRGGAAARPARAAPTALTRIISAVIALTSGLKVRHQCPPPAGGRRQLDLKAVAQATAASDSESD